MFFEVFLSDDLQQGEIEHDGRAREMGIQVYLHNGSGRSSCWMERGIDVYSSGARLPSVRRPPSSTMSVDSESRKGELQQHNGLADNTTNIDRGKYKAKA